MGDLSKSNTIISIKELAQIFNNTSASYKYYWFISLLQLFIKNKNEDSILVRDILIKMICNAWYPINYFKLNFGFSDKLQINIIQIQKELDIPIDINLDRLFTLLKENNNNKINKLITHFNQQVPYRFLSPWIEFKSNRDTIKQSQSYKNNCIYSIAAADVFKIKINPSWKDYLFNNYRILLDFTLWKLTIYVQLHNLNIPNVANKLIKPIERKSLSKQRKFWNIVFDEVNSIECIYTHKLLSKNDYDMEHFIPWSFVSHNQLWNLIPSDGSINSSKNNKLPKLNNYIKPFVEIQREAIGIVYNKQPNNKLLEDYLFIDNTIPKIINLSERKLIERFQKTMEPLIQIASNSGFQFWSVK